MKSTSLIAMAVLTPLLLSACATTASNPMALGTQANPVKADMPPGQRAYLARLVCPAGDKPQVRREGSSGPHRDGHILDGYAVQCLGQPSQTLFMDMYHAGHIENRAPEGFSLDAIPSA